MLRIGVIGYGGRASGMVKSMRVFKIPYEVTAITDPRAAEIRDADDGFLADTTFYEDADQMLDGEDLDGVMIGTNCHMHTPMACKVAARDMPLFLEKPVATSFGQVAELSQAFEGVTAPVVVSFPLRVTPIVEKVKEIIDAGEIGTVEHAVAWNDVPYGSVYYDGWYRNYDWVGGLFLQKATHDLDYITYLLGQEPAWVCAMMSQRIYGGDKPFDLKCGECPENETCPEGPFNRFYERFAGSEVTYDPRRTHCCFSEGILNEDSGNCILEFENGVQASYSQNFFARNRAGRRGARLYGYRGTIEFDWYTNAIKVFSHRRPTVDTIDFSGGMSHFGGDRELVWDFLRAMRDGTPTRTGIKSGIVSALTCLCARQSAQTRRFVKVEMPRF